MTGLLFRTARKRPTRRPRRRIVSVGNHWRVTDEGNLRAVTVREADGSLVTDYLHDEHPALVSFLERAWAVAA